MSLDLRQLRGFIAVADELHFGRAAERLSMTQPPLSQQIRQLETALTVRLFDRTKRSVALTPIGRTLLVEARRIVAGAEGLKPLAQSLARGDAGDLSLGFISTADYGILPPLLRAFTQCYPQVRLQLTEATTDIQLAALLDAHLDAGLVIGPLNGPPQGLSYRTLTQEPLLLALPEEWAQRFGNAGLTFAEVADLPLIIFPRRLAPGFYDIITGCYAALGCMARIAQEAIQMQTIVSLVSAGIGIALVPQSLRHLQRTGVVYREFAHAPSVETGLVWRSDDTGPILRHFIDIAISLPDVR